jgi:hypothetical protein
VPAPGTGNTILFAEKYAECSYWALTDGPQAPWYVATPTSGFQARPVSCDPAVPQTAHRAGLPVGMADGSTRVIHPGVSPAVWYAANSPRGSPP